MLPKRCHLSPRDVANPLFTSVFTVSHIIPTLFRLIYHRCFSLFLVFIVSVLPPKSRGILIKINFVYFSCTRVSTIPLVSLLSIKFYRSICLSSIQRRQNKSTNICYHNKNSSFCFGTATQTLLLVSIFLK